MDENREIRLLFKAWRKFLLHPPTGSSPQYLAGVKACADQLEAVLGPERVEGDDGEH